MAVTLYNVIIVFRTIACFFSPDLQLFSISIMCEAVKHLSARRAVRHRIGLPTRTSGVLRASALGAFLLLVVTWTKGICADAPLILAVHPYQKYSTLMGKYTPLADYLGEALQREVVVRIGKSYQDHVAYIGKNRVDIAIMGPVSYVTTVAQYGEQPILARFEINGRPLFQGAIIARQDSTLGNLSALRGKRFAFGDRASTMSHLIPRFMLSEAGVGVEDLADYQFLGSHDNVALAVLAGDFDVGAVKEEVFYNYQQRGLKAVALSPMLSEHLFVARSNLDPETLQTLRNALFSLGDSKRGRAIMRGIKNTMTGMVPASDADYDNLRAILRTLDEQGVR